MPDWSNLENRLAACLGPHAVTHGSDGPPSGDVPVRLVCSPADVAQLREIVGIAASERCPVYPLGGGTMMDLGGPGSAEGIGVRTTGLDRVIDYPSRDMTITVEAGTRIAKLQEILRAEGQRLPVDVPRAAEATLGGAIATNASGPRRYACGTLRDYVIGISVVDADAKETKAGGRVVKNVAGYDLCKLYIGSLGTLGIITQVTLKLRPLPEASDMLWIQFLEPAHVATALDRLAASRTRPTAIELLNSAAAEHVAGPFGPTLVTRPWVAVVGFEESADAVKWQVEQVAAELHGLAAWSRRFEGDEAVRLWSRLVEFQAADLGPLTFKANIRTSGVVEFLDHTRRQPDDWAIQVHAGNGIAYGHSARRVGPSEVQPSLTKLRELAVALRGNLIVRRCPTEWKAGLPVWGRPPSDLWLMQDLKRKLDPHGILNPGRFVV